MQVPKAGTRIHVLLLHYRWPGGRTPTEFHVLEMAFNSDALDQYSCVRDSVWHFSGVTPLQGFERLGQDILSSNKNHSSS